MIIDGAKCTICGSSYSINTDKLIDDHGIYSFRAPCGHLQWWRKYNDTFVPCGEQEKVMSDERQPDQDNGQAQAQIEGPLAQVSLPLPNNDPINHPAHYTQHPSGVECIAITEYYNFNVGNAIKYLWRAGLKTDSPLDDLKKAAWYVNREIGRLSK